VRSVKFSPLAFEEFYRGGATTRIWSRNFSTSSRIFEQHPFEGLGKPEPLKYELKGSWSRRISLEDRLVYEVKGSDIFISKCRGHYWM